jgi:hypothetical protein
MSKALKIGGAVEAVKTLNRVGVMAINEYIYTLLSY